MFWQKSLKLGRHKHTWFSFLFPSIVKATHSTHTHKEPVIFLSYFSFWVFSFWALFLSTQHSKNGHIISGLNSNIAIHLCSPLTYVWQQQSYCDKSVILWEFLNLGSLIHCLSKSISRVFICFHFFFFLPLLGNQLWFCAALYVCLVI